jgi:hypothetical protein
MMSTRPRSTRPLTALVTSLVLGSALLMATPAAAQTAPGDTLFSFNAGQLAPGGDTGLRGVVFAEGHFWVTSFNPPTYDHRLYKIAPDGSAIVQSTSLGTGYHAYYDLAFDGEFLWATDRDNLVQIDPATGQLTGEQIPTDFGYLLVGGVTYDPATDHFWVVPQRNGQLQVLHEIDRQGNVLATYPNLDSDFTTALTWDTWSPGGPYLWTFSREEVGYDSRGVLRQFSPAIGAFTGVEIAMINRSPVVADGPSGCAMTADLVDGTVAMVTVQTGALGVYDGLDWVVVYDADLRDGQPTAAITVDPASIQTEVIEGDTTTIPVTIGNLGDLDLRWNAYVEPPAGVTDGPGELGDVLATVDLAGALGPDVATTGMTFARGHYWISGRSFADGAALYQVDRDGNLVASWPIGGTSDLGWRSLVTDGDHIYGTDTYAILVWSIDEQQVVDAITTGGGIGGGPLAFDPDNGHFYLSGATGAIEVFDRDGQDVRLMITPYAIGGLAWDDRSPGGPYLWALADTGDTTGVRAQAVRLDPVSGVATGRAFLGSDPGAGQVLPEAATITRDLVDGRLALIGLQEGAGYPASAALVGYDLDTALPPAWIDLAGATLGSVVPGETATLEVGIHGTMADTTTAAVIVVASNDLAEPLLQIPVTTAMLRAVPAGVDGPGAGTPAAVLLDQNHPNPFNPTTRIAYRVPVAGAVSLQVFDARGRLVRTLVDGPQTAGEHVAVWNGRDDRGRTVASGVYTSVLQTPGGSAARKMSLVK